MKRPKLFKSPFIEGGEALFKRAMALPRRGSLVEMMHKCHPPVQFSVLKKNNKSVTKAAKTDSYSLFRNSFRNIAPLLSMPLKRMNPEKLVFEEDRWRSLFYKEYPAELERPIDLQGSPIDGGTSPETAIFKILTEQSHKDSGISVKEAYYILKKKYLSIREKEESAVGSGDCSNINKNENDNNIGNNNYNNISNNNKNNKNSSNNNNNNIGTLSERLKKESELLSTQE